MILLHHSEFRGLGGEGGETRNIRHIEVTENILCYFSRVTWCSTSTHTHTHTHTHTTIYILTATLTLPKYSVNNVYLSSFNHAVPKIRSQVCIAWIQVEADFSKYARHKCKILCWPADNQTVTRSPHPSSSRRTPATTVAKRRAKGRNSQIEQNKRWLVDAKLYKNLYEF